MARWREVTGRQESKVDELVALVVMANFELAMAVDGIAGACCLEMLPSPSKIRSPSLIPRFKTRSAPC